MEENVSVIETEEKAQEQPQEQKEKKKDHKLFYIIIAILLLLSLIAGLVVYFVYYKKYDPDVIIVKRINEDVVAYELKVGAPSDIKDVMEHAETCGYILDLIVCQKEGRHIVWDSEHNAYLLLDEKDEIVYSPLEDGTKYSLKNAWEFSESKPETCSRYVFYRANECVTTETQKTSSGREYTVETKHGIHDYKAVEIPGSVIYTCEECGYSYEVTKK